MDEESLKKVESAKRQIVEGSLEMWNERLALLRSIGNINEIIAHLRSPIEPVADNGNCGNCSCGRHLLSEVSNPGPMDR